MEPRLHSGGLRQKSKVPRARCSSQRPEYADSPPPLDYRNASLRKEYSPQGMSIHQLGDTDECKEWQRLVGERVCISGVKQGVLRYFGRTNFAQGCWCGVELDEPVGKNNGTVNGVVYFNCRPNHGIFAPVSKVSKLNILSDWESDQTLTKEQSLHSRSKEAMTKQQEQSSMLHRRSNWEYNIGLLETAEKKFIKSSISEPTFTRTTMRMPRSSESFPFDKRRVSEQRDSSPMNIPRTFEAVSESSFPFDRRSEQRDSSPMTIRDARSFEVESSMKNGRVQSGTVIKSSSSSRSLSKFGYNSNKKNQYYSSNLMCEATETSTRDSRSVNNFQNMGLTMSRAEYEQFLRTPTNSGQGSPLSSEAKRFNDMPFYDYKSPEGFLTAFQPQEFSDFEDETDDHMSVDYDESLGILTPSQMRDLTLGTDFPASLNGMRGMDFPSSESFDDINELPEDEQVHDVSVFQLSESSKTRNVEVSQQSSSGSYGAHYGEDKGPMRKTGDFLNSISQKDLEGYGVESRFDSAAGSYQDFSRTQKINNLSSPGALCSDKVNNREKEINDKCYGSKSLSKLEECAAIEHSSIVSSNLSFAPYAAAQNPGEMDTNVPEFPPQVDKTKTKNATFSEEDGPRKNYDTDSSRDSLLPAESENNTTLKEKLTVSWEDCLSRNSDSMYSHVERPESVYTVGSNDTGFQEDGELEGDMGMATSLDSNDGTKRFSTTSRDSCIVSDDGYKIAESNTTSGYSTGLSDSCCNDRAEDDLSSKPMTDEEIQDSVGPCDSEDGFSLQESNSLSKDTEMVNAEASTEVATALCNDSTSDALCETMVEDSTLTEIHDLLLSPEDKTSSTQDTKDVVDPPKDEPSEMDVSSPKERIESGSCSGSTPSHSTPERTTRVKSATIKSTRTTNRTCDHESDKKKQIAAKSPKKNVMSKIKAMIEATSCKTVSKTKPDPPEPVVSRRVVSAPKKSRWEAVTSKIAASLAEEKTKPKVKRDIRSRVDTNLTSARQQAACRSPKLDSSRLSNYGDGSMSPLSASSRDRRAAATERNSSSLREGRVKLSRDPKQRPKSPRPGITSRSASPVAASESSTTSVSLNSHNSRSKIAHWKGSNSTIASSIPPLSNAVAKRPPPVPVTKPPLQSARTRMVAKKPPTVPKIRITPSPQPRVRSSSPAVSGKAERTTTLHQRTTKEQAGGRGAHPTSKPVRPPMWLSKAELTQEIQRLGNLCEARTKELNRLKMETKHVSVGFDAFAALFKYMVEDLNGLSVPMLSADLQKTLKQLELAKQDLAYYEREVEEMKAHHCQELNDLSNKLFEVFQGEVTELSAKHQEEMNHLNHDHQKQIESLTTSLNTSSAEVIAQHEELVAKLQQELINQREELQLFQEREILDLEEKHTQSTKTLQEHIEQLQKKCAELKQHSLGMEDAMRKDTDSKLQWVTARKVDLEKEVESLKAVLEMKNKELHTIRVQNLEMEKQLEELPLAREKIKMLQARAEDLEALMIEKTKLERKLSTENHQILETYEKESKVNRRLSMENEELQWRLRQAEQSLISGSFADVIEDPEEENGSESPAKSPIKSPGPHVMSRSVFFTFVDKEDHSSPKSQYKKITPGFSANYKTSPAKSSSSKSPPAHSPRRFKSYSEPPQPPVLSSTPRKVAKQSSSSKQKSSTPKRQRSGSECGRPTAEHGDVSFLSVTGSMASSVSSECSVFEQKERFLEENKEQILHSLEILREQRIAESASEEPVTPNRTEDNSPQFDPEDMSRSSEFSDPKTYYHMTFPGEAMIPDVEDKVAVAQPTHSSSEACTLDTNGSACGATVQSDEERQHLVAPSNGDARDGDCKEQEQNTWQTV